MDFDFYISDRKHKKYMVKVENKWIHFGDKRYEHYKDQLGSYSHLDHMNPKRRKNYKKRHENTRHKKYSASWFADQILW